jgi:hypothetical protein
MPKFCIFFVLSGINSFQTISLAREWNDWAFSQMDQLPTRISSQINAPILLLLKEDLPIGVSTVLESCSTTVKSDSNALKILSSHFAFLALTDDKTTESSEVDSLAEIWLRLNEGFLFMTSVALYYKTF